MREDSEILPFLDENLQEHLLLLALEVSQHRVSDMRLNLLLVVLMEVLGFVELIAYL